MTPEDIKQLPPEDQAKARYDRERRIGRTDRMLKEVLSKVTHSDGNLVIIVAHTTEVALSYIRPRLIELAREAGLDVLLQHHVSDIMLERTSVRFLSVHQLEKLRTSQAVPRSAWLMFDNSAFDCVKEYYENAR